MLKQLNRSGCCLGCGQVAQAFVTHMPKDVVTGLTHTHTHPFNGPMSGTTQVSRYQNGKTSLDFTETRDSEWQWHQLGHMQVCTSLQTDNHASTPPLSFFRPDALPAAQPTVSVHVGNLWARGCDVIISPSSHVLHHQSDLM